MSRLDDLPPDQRAVLLLLVQQGKSHAEIADMLGISPDAVRDRAHAALSALADGPSADDDPPEISGPPPRAVTRRAHAAQGAEAPSPRLSSSSLGPASLAHIPTALPISRRGGALLLAAIVAVIVVAVILITGGGGSSHKGTTSSATAGAGHTTGTTSTGAQTSSTAGKPTEDKRIGLTSPDPSSKAVGAAEVLSEGSRYAYYIAAEHLPPSSGFFYAVWLYNSSTSHEALSKAPSVSSNGRLAGGAVLPTNAGDYHTMLLTRETSNNPAQPGPIVLSGAFALH
jgi:hypothetical protein